MKTFRAAGPVLFQIAITVLAVVGYFREPERAQVDVMIKWLLLYVVAVGHPIWWTAEHYRMYRRLAIPIDQKAYGLAWSPVWVGGTTFIIALTLF